MTRHHHRWGYVEATDHGDVYHESPVGAFCIDCQKLRNKQRRRASTAADAKPVSMTDTLSADQQRIEPTPRTTEWWDGRIDGVVLDAEGRRFGVALPITVTPDDDPDFAIEAEAAEQSVPLDVPTLYDIALAKGYEAFEDAIARLLPSEPSEPALPDEGPIHWHSDAAGTAIECHDSHSAARSAQVRQGSEGDAALLSMALRLLRQVRDSDVIFPKSEWALSQGIAAFVEETESLAASQSTAEEKCNCPESGTSGSCPFHDASSESQP